MVFSAALPRDGQLVHSKEHSPQLFLVFRSQGVLEVSVPSGYDRNFLEYKQNGSLRIWAKGNCRYL